ncbi:MAG: polysaccharide pyruvyl transferase CsaB [Candidatus Margulisbacteria bacterium]|nr:polysaccharide pyruvyl transferase CsaB [Candidatus Margulisiibacteriota bacterium]
MHLFLVGYYGFHNVGDEAILKVLIDQFRQNLNYPRISVLTKSPEVTTPQYNVISIGRNQRRKILKTMQQIEAMILGGGGLLQDSSGRGLSALYYLALIFLAKWFRKKVVFLAQGIGPLRKRRSRWVTKLLLNRVDFISVRENESKNYLRKLGIRRKINVIPDPAILMAVKPEETLEKKYLGVSLRSGFFRDVQDLAQQLDRVIATMNLKIIFFSFQKNFDDLLIEKVRLLMKHTKQTEIFGNDKTPEEVIEKIGECQMLIGARLHSLIFAAKKHIPFLGLNYDPKVAAFCKTLGMPWLKLDEVNYLTESVRSLWNQKEPLLKLMRKRLAEWERIAILGMKKCLEYIKA